MSVLEEWPLEDRAGVWWETSGVDKKVEDVVFLDGVHSTQYLGSFLVELRFRAIPLCLPLA